MLVLHRKILSKSLLWREIMEKDIHRKLEWWFRSPLRRSYCQKQSMAIKISQTCFEVAMHRKCLHKECIHLLQMPLNTKLTLSDLAIQVSFNTMQTLWFWHKTIYQCKYQSFKYLVHRQQMLSTWSFSLRFYITATVMWKNWQIVINWPFPANILSSKLDTKLREKTCY